MTKARALGCGEECLDPAWLHLLLWAPGEIAKAQASGERKSGQLTTGGRGCGGRLEDPKAQVSEERSLPRRIIPHRRQLPQFSNPRWQGSQYKTRPCSAHSASGPLPGVPGSKGGYVILKLCGYARGRR